MGKLLARHRLPRPIPVDGFPFVDVDDVRPSLKAYPVSAGLALVLVAGFHDDESGLPMERCGLDAVWLCLRRSDHIKAGKAELRVHGSARLFSRACKVEQ